MEPMDARADRLADPGRVAKLLHYVVETRSTDEHVGHVLRRFEVAMPFLTP